MSSSKIAARQIELELKRAKLEANHKLALTQARAEAAQEQAAQALAQARRCAEKAELDAEERLISGFRSVAQWLLYVDADLFLPHKE